MASNQLPDGLQDLFTLGEDMATAFTPPPGHGRGFLPVPIQRAARKDVGRAGSPLPAEAWVDNRTARTE